MLLARRGQHASNLAKPLLHDLAGIIIDDLFRTGENESQNTAGPSHIALTAFYGRSFEAEDSVRTNIDCNLKSDTFAEVDIVNEPPQGGCGHGKLLYSAGKVIDCR